MNRQHKLFVGMTHVRDDYTNTGLSDTAFAELITKRTGQPYSMAEVRQYRKSLSIANNAPRDSRDQVIEDLRKLVHSLMEDAESEGRVFAPQERLTATQLGVAL